MGGLGLLVLGRGRNGNGLTVHEIRHINQKAASLSIVVAEYPVIHELPAKCIGDVHHESSDCYAFWW